MTVKAGDLLFRIDDSDLAYNISKTRNSIKKLQLSAQDTLDSIKDLDVYAVRDDRLVNFNVKEGEQLGAGNTKTGTLV
ncbi:MAG: hypothetical protein Q7J78_01635 [Clostridiales bacterium]|nr:hypothetical protein [Clostridiales bacterium]